MKLVLVSEHLPTLVNLYTKLDILVNCKSIQAAIDHIKKPIPDVVIKKDDLSSKIKVEDQDLLHF